MANLSLSIIDTVVSANSGDTVYLPNVFNMPNVVFFIEIPAAGTVNVVPQPGQRINDVVGTFSVKVSQPQAVAITPDSQSQNWNLKSTTYNRTQGSWNGGIVTGAVVLSPLPGTVALTINQAASSASDLLNISSAGGTVGDILNINSSWVATFGNVIQAPQGVWYGTNLGSALNPDGSISQVLASDAVALNVNLAIGQTSDAVKVRNSSGTKVFGVDSAGRTSISPAAAPAAPTTGWTLFVDSGDGNKLKAIASTGTVVTLGVP